MRTIKLITCNDAMKAHILQGALENEGIDSVLHNENFSSLMKGYISNISGVDIFVAEEDYGKAVQVLRANQSWPEELTLCPHCGSSDIKMELKKGHRARAVGVAILSMLAVVPPGNNHWDYVCNQCHETFDMPVSELNTPPELDSSEDEEEKDEKSDITIL